MKRFSMTIYFTVLMCSFCVGILSPYLRLSKGETIFKDTDEQIFEAAKTGDYTKIQEVLKTYSLLVNIKDKDDLTLLHWTSFKGYKEITELLLANGAQVNAKTKNKFTPLHLATRMGHKEVVQLLLAKGAAVNEQDYQGQTALHEAALCGHKDIAELLLANGPISTLRVIWATHPFTRPRLKVARK